MFIEIFAFSLSLFPIRQNDSAAKAGLLLTDVSHAAGRLCGASSIVFWVKSSNFAQWRTNISVDIEKKANVFRVKWGLIDDLVS